MLICYNAKLFSIIFVYTMNIKPPIKMSFSDSTGIEQTDDIKLYK